MNKPLTSQLITSLGILLLLAGCVGSPAPVQERSDAEKLQASGVRLYNDGDYRKALPRFKQALHQHRVVDDEHGIITSSINIARTYLDMGDSQSARQWADKAASLLQGSQLNSGLKHNLSLLSARIHIKDKSYNSASKVLDGINGNQSAATQLQLLRLRTEIAFANDKDRELHTKNYETATKSSAASNDIHKSRANRFRAKLEQDTDSKNRYYSKALELARQSRKQGVIAATLQDWANDIDEGAQDRLLRALYIRASNHDVANTRQVLVQLQKIAGDTPSKQTIDYWKNKLEETGFNYWGNLVRDFETFPQ